MIGIAVSASQPPEPGTSEPTPASAETECPTTPSPSTGTVASIRYPDVSVVLTGTDGNVYALIGRVSSALRTHAGDDAAREFTAAAFACGSYDEVLHLMMCTVDVR